MQDTIIKSFDIWTDAQGVKSRGRLRSIDNISLEGIGRLRELILELAIRGKLVPQDANDEPASELLRKIGKEKARLISEGTLKKDKPLPAVSDEEMPFPMPQNWTYCRLGFLVNSMISGGTPSKSNPNFWNGNIPWASVKDLGKSKYISETEDYITLEGLSAGSKLADVGDIIICTRMGLGKIAIAQVPLAINQDLKAARLTSQLDIDYFFIFFRTLKIKGTGTTVSGIKQDELLQYIVPLPPAAEQHRIVAKVDELMALCDKLESAQTANLKTHQTLVKALLQTLTDAKDADSVAAAWQRMAPHFDTLFCTEDSIEQLKQTVLQLAIMGRLVKQDPADEPASTLIKRLEAEKAKLISAGKLKKEKPLPMISDNEKPFELPKGWEWVKLANVSGDIHYGYTASANHQVSDYRLLRITDIQNDSVDWESVPGCEIKEEQALCYLLEDGDILIARTGGTIGKSYLVSGITVNSVFASYLIRVRSIASAYPKFIKLYLGSELYWSQLYESSMGTGQPNVNGQALKNLKVPFPPLAEQHRIVDKVEELMALCDSLKARIQKAEAVKVQLATNMVENAVKSSIEQNGKSHIPF